MSDVSPDEWSRLLKHNWSQRAASPNRDFYVASHPGWQDPARWRRQAEVDVDLLLKGLDPVEVRELDVLEIGCGVGRLAEPLLARVRSYTGFDIAADMVAEARRRVASERARFFESDGLGVPEPCRNKSYGLAIALAVFIHCPREVTLALVGSAYELLLPGAQLRFQVLADPDDPTGVMEAPAAEQTHEEIVEMESAATDDQRSLIDGHYYMGDAWGYGEVSERFGACTGGTVETMRFDLGHIYGWVEKPARGP